MHAHMRTRARVCVYLLFTINWRHFSSPRKNQDGGSGVTGNPPRCRQQHGVRFAERDTFSTFSSPRERPAACSAPIGRYRYSLSAIKIVCLTRLSKATRRSFHAKHKP